MTDKATLLALADELERATEGSRELDAKIVAVLNGAIVKPYPPPEDYGTHNRWQFWTADGRHFLGSESKFPVPRYTTSVDAAITLVPKGWRVYRLAEDEDGWEAWLVDPESYDGWGFFDRHAVVDVNKDGNGIATMALALCAASLRALAEGGES